MTAEPPRWSPRVRSEWLNLRLGEFHWTHDDLTDVNLKARHSCPLCRAFRERHLPPPGERKTSPRREVVAV